MNKKYLRLKLNAPEFFNGKTIEHNGFTIEYNKDYIGEQDPNLAIAMKQIEEATINPCHPTRIFNAAIIEDNIDIDNLPYSTRSNEDSTVWFNLRDLGFIIQNNPPMGNGWTDTRSITAGWPYRISPDCKLTLDDIRNQSETA